MSILNVCDIGGKHRYIIIYPIGAQLSWWIVFQYKPDIRVRIQPAGHKWAYKFKVTYIITIYLLDWVLWHLEKSLWAILGTQKTDFDQQGSPLYTQVASVFHGYFYNDVITCSSALILIIISKDVITSLSNQPNYSIHQAHWLLSFYIQ